MCNIDVAAMTRAQEGDMVSANHEETPKCSKCAFTAVAARAW